MTVRLRCGQTTCLDWAMIRLSGSIALAYAQLSIAFAGRRIWLYFTWVEERGGP